MMKTIQEECLPEAARLAEDLVRDEISKEKNRALKDVEKIAYDTGEKAYALTRDVMDAKQEAENLLDSIRDKGHEQIEEKKADLLEKKKKRQKKCEDALRCAGLLALTACAVKQTCAFIDALKFKKSVDINPESLDSCVVCSRQEFMYPNSEMKDLRAGCFMGDSTIDFNGIDAPSRQYDMDIRINEGTMRVIVPDNWQLHITTRKKCGCVENHTKPVDIREDGPVLVIYAEITCGRLILDN